VLAQRGGEAAQRIFPAQFRVDGGVADGVIAMGEA
jgi:hypothetical protein